MMKPIFALSLSFLFGTLAFAQSPDIPISPTATPPVPVTYSDQSVKGVDAAVVAELANNAPNKAFQDYIQQYKDAAINEMERVGIPASITLAQAILESNAGQSDLAKAANNHFGIKCTSTWEGKTYKKKDDDRDENGDLKESCFRKYSKVDESFFDHSEFLRDPRKYYRYGFLFGLDKTDYRGWARGLESSGYATAPGYADKLIGLIDKYQLYQFDNPSTQVLSTSTTGNDGEAAKSRVGRVNDVKLVLSREGETLDDIARMFYIKTEKVADYNERHFTPGQTLRVGTRIFIQDKKSKWRGRATHHFVREDQTMFDISQQYGIELSDFYKRNGIMPGQEPAVGEQVRIKGRRKSNELIRLREVTTPTNNGTTKPNSTNKPTKPATSTTDEELPEITAGDNGKPAPVPAPNKPATTTGTNPTPTPGTKPTTPGTKPTTPNNTIPGTKPATNTPPTKPATGTTPYPPPVTRPVDPTPVPSLPTTPAVNQPGYHTVVKGDTLFSLSRKYGTPVAKIKSLNGMVADDIKIGQKLRVQ